MLRGALLFRGTLTVGRAPDTQKAPGIQRAPDCWGPLIIRGALIFRRVTDDDWLSLGPLIVTGTLFSGEPRRSEGPRLL